MADSPGDERVASSVANVLKRDPRVRTEGMSVQVRDGMVILSGTVPQHRDRLAAADVAWSTEGVRDVKNRLRVQAELERASMDMANDLAEALDRDERVNTEGIVVNVSEGVVRLSGTVSSQEERKAAEQVAWSTGGVVDVANGLLLSPNKRRPDEEIARDVERCLAEDARLRDVTRIGVRSAAGTVRLEGTVASAEERELAEEDAWCTPGVVYVENMLTVRRRLEPPTAA